MSKPRAMTTDEAVVLMSGFSQRLSEAGVPHLVVIAPDEKCTGKLSVKSAGDLHTLAITVSVEVTDELRDTRPDTWEKDALAFSEAIAKGVRFFTGHDNKEAEQPMIDSQNPGLPPVLDRFPIGAQVFYIHCRDEWGATWDLSSCPWNIKKCTVAGHYYETSCGWKIATESDSYISLGMCFPTYADARRLVRAQVANLKAAFFPAGEDL